MSNMEEILANQQHLLSAIEQIYINFKKDSPDRKTADYINRRLDTLDKYWRDFQANHKLLCGIEYAMSHSYFTSNQFESAKDKYENIKVAIANYQIREDRPATPVLKPATPLGVLGTSRQPSPQVTLSQSQGTNSKTDEMLRKQNSNFKAFEHTVSNINIDSVSEKWEFEHLLRVIQSRWSIIDNMHWELDSELGGRNPDYELSFFTYEKKYNETIKSINRKLWSVSHREQSTPHVEIPTFSGSYHQWCSFKDLFTETIHGNPTLSNAQKMQFLKTKVRGEAERLIQHLPITSDNYPICWNILNHRYNNKRLIFRSHIDILLNIPILQQASVNHIKRIHDTTLETLNAIKNLGIDVESWDSILVHLLSQKLDADTHNEYVSSVKEPRELPNLQEFLAFLEGKFTSLESSRKKSEIPTKNSQNNYNNHSPSHSNNRYHRNLNKQAFPTHSKFTWQPNVKNNTSRKFYKCALCKTNDHCLYYCRQFLNMTPYVKCKTVTKLNVCENCLYSHNGKACISDKRCNECNEAHNTILHQAFQHNYNISKLATGGSIQKPETSGQVRSNSHVSLQRDMPEILLATAMLKVQKRDGSFVNIRALIDQGSQTSIISEHAAQQLGHPRLPCRGVISGVGVKESSCKGVMTVKCVATNNNFEFETEAYIMKNLIKNLPNYSFSKPTWSYLNNITLADPEFNISRPVDLLLGADIYSLILLEGICRIADNIPIAQNTRLGWILTGNVTTLQCNAIINDVREIQKFWEMEDISVDSTMSVDDQECIDYYKSTTIRREDGRYEVRLPLVPDFSDKLGQSQSKAIAQFRSLEKTFKNHNNIEKQYKAFMNEYYTLGHMIPVAGNAKPERQHCVLTHHCVRSGNNTTNAKFRVVFNASSKTSSGNSLNDVMRCGPNLQQDLQSLIIRWRQYQFAFTADIEKMFRQIWIHPEDQQMQRIVWRDSPSEPIQDYQLTTVTYGTKAAPFLAMMTLKQLAFDEANNYQQSQAIDALNNCFYMDDLVHGCHDINTAYQLQQDLINLLDSAGFRLRKWRSNTEKLIVEEPTTLSGDDNFNFKQPEQTKTLGLTWNPHDDVFTFILNIQPGEVSNKITKRILLSDISKLYDPLGWLSPLSTKLKIIFQQLWATDKLSWDDPIPNHIYIEWKKVREDMPIIENIKLPRWLHINQCDSIELHGFSDSSLKAYACVIYCRVNKDDKSFVTLLAGKTKLVPTSKTVTLPRLELSAALLLSKLMNKIQQCLTGHNIVTYGWIDSMVVLGWLSGEPTRWKTFVANRVRAITEIMPPECWRYVKSEENPADCASRGVTASQLKEHSLWWQGPAWLPTFESETIKLAYTTDEELKISKPINLVTQYQPSPIIQEILFKYSKFNKVVKIVAWIRRIITIKKEQNKKYLSVKELKRARLSIIRNVQQIVFERELSDLKQGNKINRKSNLCELNPYIDQDDVMRVGGRLRHAHLDPDMKNPIIIPSNSRLADLLIDQAHEMTYHGGARLTSAFLRQKYWVVGGNRAVKKRLRLCIICRRQEPTKTYQIMGDLPAARANPSRPFEHVAVDYTGHVFIKANSGRGIKTTKGYIAVFTCMVTKAVHLELVSELTSTAFLAALRRMAARRGKPHHIYSDNGTNFVGANKVLQQEYEELLKTFDPEFHAVVADMGITWHFNAPSWPSANGLCEGAVKSLKFHLKRVVGDQKLTYEEYSTVLAQLEGCLNSRPLCPLTEDPEDLNYLTPSHFLSSGPILSIYNTERDLRTRWYLTEKIFQDIWKRWQQEYLTSMSARSKWRQPRDNIRINDIVLINDGNLPPGKWALGRVIELHPGRDGYVRVVTLKTKNGCMKRPIIKLSILPINHEEAKNQEVKQQETTNTARPRRRRYGFATVATSIILFFMTLLSNTYGLYTIHKLQNNTGLFFDKITNMHLIAEDWKLIVYYDLNPYWEGTTACTKYMEYLETICLKIREHSHCDGVMSQLNHEQSDLQHYNIMLQDKQSNLRTRQRRGLINGVGSIANSLFGILDNSFAEKYAEDIKLLRDNESHLAQLWKNQTSVVEAEFNLIKRSEYIMEKYHKTVNKKMFELKQAVSALKAESLDNSYLSEFTLAAIVTSNIINKLKEIQSDLLDTITDVFHGNFNIHLLTPEQLQHELSIISTQIPKELSLPTDYAILSTFYKLLNVKARLSKSFMIFEIKIPLIARDIYEVLQIVPIPKQSGNNMISIVPVSEYLALNLNKDSFLSLTFTDLRDCIERDTDTVLCRFKKPIYHMDSDKSLCQKSEESGSCRTIIDTCKNIFMATSKLNTYFYFCCAKCYYKLLCEDQITAIQVSHAGLITLSPGCLIKSADFHLYAYKQDASTITLKPKVSVPEIAPINHLINISIPELNTSTSSEIVNQKQLLAVQEQLDIMKQSEPLAERVSYHDIHHYAAIYLVMAAAGVFIGIYVWRRVQRSRSRAGRDGGKNKCSEVQCSEVRCSEVQCVDVGLQTTAVQCNSGDFTTELNEKFKSTRRLRHSRGTSPILQSVFTIADSGV